MNNYSTAKDAERFVFYRIPKALITAKEYRYISTDASIYFISRGHIVTPVDASAEMCKIAAENTCVKVRQLRFENLDYFEAFDGI